MQGIVAALMTALALALATGAPAQERAGSPGPYPLKMHEGRNSASPPLVRDGVVDFTLLPGQCQARTYGDGRGESDCKNLNAKSYLAAGEVPIGSSMAYGFDIRVVRGLTHAAFRNPRMVPFTGGPDSRLRVAVWQGNLLHNYLYSLKLDSTRGLTFLGRTCVAPGQLKQWNRFEMLVKWSAKSDGVMQVRCNGRLIYSVSGVPTDQQPQCVISNICEPGIEKHPRKIITGFGLFFNKEVVHDVEMMPRIPKGGLTIEMRNFTDRKVRITSP